MRLKLFHLMHPSLKCTITFPYGSSDSTRVSGISVFSEDIKRIIPNSLYMQPCNLIPNNWPQGWVAQSCSDSSDLDSTFSSFLMLCSWWLCKKRKKKKSSVRTCIATTFTLTTSPIHPLSLFGSLNFFFFFKSAQQSIHQGQSFCSDER